MRLLTRWPGRRLDRYIEAVLFLDLANQAVLDGFVEFEDAAGRFPVAVVAPLRGEHVPGIVDNDAATLTGWRAGSVPAMFTPSR